MSLDLRTRQDTDVPAIEPATFFEADLPALLDASPELLASTAAV